MVLRMERVLAFTAVEPSGTVVVIPASAHRRPRSIGMGGQWQTDSAPPRWRRRFSPTDGRSPGFLHWPVSWRLFVSTLALDDHRRLPPALVPRDHVCFAHRRDVWLVFKPESFKPVSRSTLLMLVAVMTGGLAAGICTCWPNANRLDLAATRALQVRDQKPPNGQRQLMLL